MITEKRKLWKLLLFTIPTLGIYNIYFWFRFTQDLNEMNRTEKKMKNYFLVLFLSIITFGIYRWVWLFYIEDRLQLTGEELDIKIHPGPGLTLFFWTFGKFILIGPIIADFFIIRNMNRLAKEYNASISKKTKVLNKDLSNATALKDSQKTNEKNPASAKPVTNTKPVGVPKSDSTPATTNINVSTNAKQNVANNQNVPKQSVPQNKKPQPTVSIQQGAAKPATTNTQTTNKQPATGKQPINTNHTTKVVPEKQKVVNKQVITPTNEKK